MSRLMVCDECWALWGPYPPELKTMGAPAGPCCVCDARVLCGGPIKAVEACELRRRRRRAQGLEKNGGQRVKALVGELVLLKHGRDLTDQQLLVALCDVIPVAVGLYVDELVLERGLIEPQIIMQGLEPHPDLGPPAPAYVGDGHPAVRDAALELTRRGVYERDPNEPEPEVQP